MKPRVLFLSGREVGYIRNRVLLAALRTSCSVTVLTARVPTIPGRVTASLGNLIGRRPEYDVCIAGFYGQPIAIALSRLQQFPIILDAYVSTYDTLCADRGWFGPGSLVGRLARWLDVRGCGAASRVLTDTQAHACYFTKQLGVAADKIVPVYVGCDEELFYPREHSADAGGCFNVFYYGSFLRLHGTDSIVQAAALLRDRPEIRFIFGGDGPRRRAVQQMVTDLGVENIEYVGWIPIEKVPSYIARADLCLGGHFSTVAKAARVIPTKVFQFVAMRKPAIIGDNAATRELFVHRDNAWMVRMGDPQALAEGIAKLAEDSPLRHQIAANGRQIYEERLTTQAIATRLISVIDEARCTSVS
jgi:glycosyltransferase involved in cell wall biosynthesis